MKKDITLLDLNDNYELIYLNHGTDARGAFPIEVSIKQNSTNLIFSTGIFACSKVVGEYMFLKKFIDY